MSCGGNRFQCALTKSTRISFQPDKPSNPELHNENQKRLNDLLKAREEQDKIYTFTSKTNESDKQLNQVKPTLEVQQTITNYEPLNNTDIQYTPWKVPSSEYKTK